MRIGRVLLFILGCAAAVAIIAPFASKLPGKWPELAIGAASGVAAFLLTVVFARWEGLSLNDAGAAADARTPVRLLIGFGAGLLLVAIWAALTGALGIVRWERGSGVTPAATAMALIAYLSLSCREELAFRGYPLRILHRVAGLWVAQLSIALLFALEHKVGGSSWTDALLGPAVGSLLFGMAAIATRGLAVPIGVHAAWNFGQWMLGLKGNAGILRSVVADERRETAHVLATMIYIGVIGAATFGFWLWHRRSQNASVSLSEA